ncbi:ABC transporter substrate-binding protein [Promicromonospora soli]|uniref:DNA-binding protein n=1 Tax=Promicromonospora soli TaxID=2035533 RepID=A0A919FHP3_9MICO|nr:ABC transporter substrate-binding protein [Promicromonospora soli]GHH64812.1 DNA-binding protein [Promicromonospora soli]
MQFRRRKFATSSVAVLALMLSACGGGGGSGTSEPGASHETADKVTIAIASDEGTLTPFTNQTGYPGNNLVKLVFDTLAVVRGDEVVGLLAEELKTEDNQTYTLPLRDGLTWHDGEELTAEDVVFSVEFYRDHAEGDSAVDVSMIEDVSAEGSTVTMVLDRPDPEFSRMVLADMAILPEHLWADVQKVSEAGADLAVGSGPYVLDSYDNSRGYTLTANPDYAPGEVKVGTIEVAVIPEESTQFAALRTGEIDMSTRIVPPQQLEQLQSQANIEIVEGTEFASTLLLFNNGRPPFDDPAVRRAITQAIDTRDLIDTALLGSGTPGSPGFVHPASPMAAGDGSPYDVDAANAALDELGAEPGADGVRVLDGEPMSYDLLVQSTSTDRLRSAELIREMLSEVGIEVKISSMESDSLDAKVWPDYDVAQGRNYDMSMWGWSAPVMLSSGLIAQLLYSDPADGPLNVAGFSDPETDAALDALTAEETLEGRVAAAADLQTRIAEQAPWVTLYYRDGAYAFRSDTYSGWTWQDGRSVLNGFSFVDYDL